MMSLLSNMYERALRRRACGFPSLMHSLQAFRVTQHLRTGNRANGKQVNKIMNGTRHYAHAGARTVAGAAVATIIISGHFSSYLHSTIQVVCRSSDHNLNKLVIFN